ncbi:hypothetical protein Tco_0005828 [Tanacetum coccineum]
MVAWFLGLEDVLSWLLVEGKRDAITVDINAISLFRQAIVSSPGRNDGTASPESSRGSSACGCCEIKGINEGEGKITVWEELVEKFFSKFYPESYDGEEEMLDEGDNWGIDPLEFISRNETEKDNELSQTKRKYSNTSNYIDEQPYKRICKAEKFEAINYSLGPNEEYIAIRRCEYDAWERNKDRMSIIYQEIFQKKDNGWKDLVKEISTNIGGEFTNLEILKYWSLETQE